MHGVSTDDGKWDPQGRRSLNMHLHTYMSIEKR